MQKLKGTLKERIGFYTGSHSGSSCCQGFATSSSGTVPLQNSTPKAPAGFLPEQPAIPPGFECHCRPPPPPPPPAGFLAQQHEASTVLTRSNSSSQRRLLSELARLQGGGWHLGSLASNALFQELARHLKHTGGKPIFRGVPWQPASAAPSVSSNLRRTPTSPPAALPHPRAPSAAEPGAAGAEPRPGRGTREGPAGRSPRPGHLPPPAAAAPELPQRPASRQLQSGSPRGCAQRSGAGLPPGRSPRYRRPCARRAAAVPRGAGTVSPRCRYGVPTVSLRCRYRPVPLVPLPLRTRGSLAAPRSAPPGPAPRRPDITAGQCRPRPPRRAELLLAQSAWRQVWPRPRRGERPRCG